ncbi:MAG: signal recognition particle-docking protein FtsY [Candidatus Aenigmarchaeota archaeon]|nr:signal recognition particle-docking protein FtsY [Candidatus Aenigmarchaeota archaeon]
MFGILKDKLSKAIKSISEKFKEKEQEPKKEEPKPESVQSTVENPVEKIEAPIEKPIETPTEQLFPEPATIVTAPAIEKPTEKIAEEKPTLLKEETKPKPEKKEELKPVIITKKSEQIVKQVGILKPPEKKSFISKIFEKAVKTVTEKRIDEKDLLPVLNELETDLIDADVAIDVAERIKADLLKGLVGKEIRRGKESEEIVSAFRQSLLGILDVPQVDLEKLSDTKKPVVLLFLGFNGSGKTTSIAKIANFLKERGHSVVLAAADSWRAAAIEQLEEHADKIGVNVIKHNYGSDPAAIVYDAVEHAKAKGIEYVLADSAGRVHTNQNLMQELQKMVRVNKPDLKVLIIDSMTGNDALEQARAFGGIGVDAVIFTKVDVNEKGGAILSVTNELRKPILFLGIGQEYKDFEKFDAEKFVSRVLG